MCNVISSKHVKRDARLMRTNIAIVHLIVEEWSMVNVSMISLVKRLIHCCLVTPYVDIDWRQLCPGNGVWTDGNKPSPAPMLTHH